MRFMGYTILHTEASLGWGGQEIRILNESLGMRERGHMLLIAAHPGSGLFSRAGREGIRTIPFCFRRRNFLGALRFFKRFIETEGVDIVNTHSSKDSWLVLPAGRIAANGPFVLRTRHLSTRIHKGLHNRFLYQYLPDLVITTGEAIKNRMIRENSFSPEKIVSVPTGVNLDHFNPEAGGLDLRKELSLSPATPLVGAVSVIRSWKGLDFLVGAVAHILKKVPETRFIIAGDGPYLDRLKKAIEETGKGDKIYLLGHREDVADIMQSIDILVHPSYANEGVPQAVLQAMAMQKPVIVSDIPPFREVIVNGDTGIIVRKKDPSAIASAVVSLLSDKDLSGKLGSNARRTVMARFSYSGMLDKLEALYRRKTGHV
jgi:glycosyltransferase involved in cell wall biosynthesis